MLVAWDVFQGVIALLAALVVWTLIVGVILDRAETAHRRRSTQRRRRHLGGPRHSLP